LRIPRKLSSLLIGLGLLLTITMVISGLVDAQKDTSPYKEVISVVQSNSGFDPIIVPDPELISTQGAQNSTPQTTGLGAAMPTSTPVPIWIPDRIVIPAIKLDVTVSAARLRKIEFDGITYQQWVAPSYAVGFVTTSAPLGAPGNTVLLGHHNVYGEVFGHLVDLQIGDLILIYSGEKEFAYLITQKMILPERWQTIEVKLKNAQWTAPTQDERLTLLTCWPYENNTHRLFIVDLPINLITIQDHHVTQRLTPHPPVNLKSTSTIPPQN
jgi:LPXTG-site transpeptidase (sortase) family protein